MGSAASHAHPHVETNAAVVEVEPDGVVVVRVKAIDMDADRMREVLRARFELVPRAAPVLVDARRVRSMSREAQGLTVSAAERPYPDCLAILMDGPVSVVLGNFFMVFVKPPYPTKLFRDEGVARAWLRESRSLVE